MVFRPGIMARLTLTVGIGLVTLGYSKCVFVSNTGDPVGGAPDGGVTFSTNLTLRDATGVASSSFRFGEPIRFDLEVRNRTPQTVNLVFDDAQIYDFVVLNAANSRVLWRWSDGMTFAQVVTELTFEPFSSKTYSVTWNGILGDGTQLPPGNYRARGALVFDAFASDPLASHEQASPLVDFSVR